MQPDSESTISRKVGGSAQRDLTPTQKTATAGANKKNSTMIGGTPTGRSSAKQKTDISQYFKKLDNSVMTTPITNILTKTTTPGARTESPATLLLNRINSNNYTPLMMQEKKTGRTQTQKITSITARNDIECYDEESRDSTTNVVGGDISKTQKVKKALDFFQHSQEEEEDNRNVATTTKTRRRSSIFAAATIMDNGNNKAPPISEDNASMATPSKITRRRSILAVEATETTTLTMQTPNNKNTRRRSSIHTPKNMTMETPSKNIQIQPITEEDESNHQGGEMCGNQTNSSSAAIKARRTLHVAKTMEISEATNTTTSSSNAIKENQPKSSLRRTINSYANKKNASPTNDCSGGNLDLSNVATRRPTCYSVKSMETSSIIAKDGDTKLEKTIEMTNQFFNVLMKKNEQPNEPPKTVAATTNRRRTLYTPKKVSDSTFSKTNGGSQSSAEEGLCITPTASNMHGKVVACSTLLEEEESREKPKLMETPPANATTGKLLEETVECATPLIFSSTRQPGNKRRTLFDVSMDIITQRLQCINQSARRSLAPTTTTLIGGDDDNADVKSCNTPPLPETLVGNRQASFDLENSNSSDQHNVTISRGESIENNDSNGSTPALQKKRKLFAPNELLTPPPINIPAAAVSEQKKRRRTLLPLSQTILSTSSTMSTNDLLSATNESSPQVLKRRSTLDFEQIKKYQNKMSRKTQQGVEANTGGGVGGKHLKAKKPTGLVYTNMHSEQIDVIREVVNKLSAFDIEQTVTDNTTHLVSLEPRRTMNLLRAISRGLWVVDYNWILDSQKAGEWLPEEPYELRSFSRAVEICRSERQAFGEHYKCELFRDLGAFYISLRCYPVTKNDLCELITLCGGRLALSRNKAKYIIGDTNQSLEDKIYVTPYWILDSISQMQIMKIQKYLCVKPGEEMPLPTSPVVVKATAQVEN
ncbi:uncharacterized protein LOC133332375 [Musca vetustissima]|uniref:uncharacterized protein LOC133332375 n=1 Tax=Musca vetustissima TaxID=27455 RepID=UPI002AB7AC52|nr:uncharacterized protein LOC133332375 [Musca vetustissima]